MKLLRTKNTTSSSKATNNFLSKVFLRSKSHSSEKHQPVKKFNFFSGRLLRPLFICFTGLLALIISIEIVYRESNKGVVLPNVYFLGDNISGLNKESFSKRLSSTVSAFEEIIIHIDGRDYQINTKDIKYHVDIENNWTSAYNGKRNFKYLSFPEYFQRKDIPLTFDYDKQIFTNKVDEVSSSASNEVILETITLVNKGIEITPGHDGSQVDISELHDLILKSLNSLNDEVLISTKKIDSSFDRTERENLVKISEGLIGKKIIVSLNKDLYELSDEDLINTLNDRQENNNPNIKFITKNISNYFSKEPKDSVFVFENGRVVEFVASQDGILIDEVLLKEEILKLRDSLSVSTDVQILLPLPHSIIKPKTNTSDINNLGIKEKIGSGYSSFRGSIPSRIHNIKLAASKFNGILILPDETFSFNKILGDVSKVTGYQPAYIIRDGQTILGDGGGVCQVSTTLFRSALNAGLPIVERRAHSYRVSYYEQDSSVGLDATVFDPSTDLKIKNDTGEHILIQTLFDENKKTLVFDLYGTNDGRVSSIGKTVFISTSPPPDDLYIDDPTLKVGVVKQIDHKAWGAKVYFDYKVENNGLVIYEKTFYSNYQPWQAKFLRGTGMI